MKDAPFDACWHRWERAREVMVELPKIWNSYIESHPYDFTLNGDGAGGYTLRVFQTEPMPAEFAIAMGEWLYNLRSTLDYVVWAAAVHVSGRRPPPHENQLQYPIYDTKEAWARNLYRLKDLAPHHVEMLHVMQPYNSDSDANCLGWINRLARIDRHRRLMDGTAYLAIMEPVVQVPGGSMATLEWGDRVLVDGWADVVRIKVDPWDPDAEVSMNPRLGLDPEIREWSESPFWRRIRFDERMKIMQVSVSAEIAAYEYDCTGASRKADLLADNFKVEADARRVLQPVESPDRRPIAWEPSLPGRSTTSAAVDGSDFPPHGPGDYDSYTAPDVIGDELD